MQGMGGWGHLIAPFYSIAANQGSISHKMQHVNPHLALTAAVLAGKERNGLKDDLKSIAIATNTCNNKRAWLGIQMGVAKRAWLKS